MNKYLKVNFLFDSEQIIGNNLKIHFCTLIIMQGRVYRGTKCQYRVVKLKTGDIPVRSFSSLTYLNIIYQLC